jgi:3-oxoacyl-[acyl-carrier-protein] synthase III
MCLADAIRQKRIRIGDYVLLSGFGVGLSYATTSFRYGSEIHVS